MSDPGLSAQVQTALRNSDADAAGQLLQRFRPWLHLLARVQLDARFQGKFDASDIVQQTLLHAVRDLPQFRGNTDSELAAWLKQILAHTLGHEVRRYLGTQKRDAGREVSIDESLDQSSQQLRNVLAADDTSPSESAARHEQEVLLADVLERLPPDYREVIILRNIQGLSHTEVADRMNRKPGAVRMLWVRALARLQQEATHVQVGTLSRPAFLIVLSGRSPNRLPGVAENARGRTFETEIGCRYDSGPLRRLRQSAAQDRPGPTQAARPGFSGMWTQGRSRRVGITSSIHADRLFQGASW